MISSVSSFFSSFNRQPDIESNSRVGSSVEACPIPDLDNAQEALVQNPLNTRRVDLVGAAVITATVLVILGGAAVSFYIVLSWLHQP